MKAYVITTGVLFGLLTILHMWRVITEGSHVADAWMILITALTTALFVWACVLLARSRP
jgi:hypothetical protein